MKSEIKYIELKSGYSDNGPAWIGMVEFSKSGKTVYFNGKAFKGNGHGTCYDLENGDEYWISGVKKDGGDRHWAGNGMVMIDRTIVDEYLELVSFNTLDPKSFQLVDIQTTDKQKFNEIENEKFTDPEFNDSLRFKKPNELSNEELQFVIQLLEEDEMNAPFNKARRSIKHRRIKFEEELKTRAH